MSIKRSLTVIAGCGVAFAAAGGTLGTSLGLGTPAYYGGPGCNPVQVGLGRGVTQGAIVGILVGCVVVLAAALVDRPRPRSDAFTGTPARSQPFAARLAAILLLCLIPAATGGIVGFLVGAWSDGALRARHDLDRLLPILQEPAFRGLSADVCPHNEIHLDGAVGSEEDRRDLESRLRSLYGDAQAKELMYGIPIAPPNSEAGEIRPRPSPAEPK